LEELLQAGTEKAPGLTETTGFLFEVAYLQAFVSESQRFTRPRFLKGAYLSWLRGNLIPIVWTAGRQQANNMVSRG